jgi:predicted enzyme related to lactoylglutathione lyase
VIRFALVVSAALVPIAASAQSAGPNGAPVVFFSIFGQNGPELQRFYADLFDWTIKPDGDLTTVVASPLEASIGQGVAETIVYVGVSDITATLEKVKARGGTIRYPRFEVKGRVVLGIFKDPAGNSVGLVEMENGKAKIP